MRYALAFLFVLLFTSCDGSDPSGSSTPNASGQDGVSDDINDPEWDANFERAKALCKPAYDELVAPQGDTLCHNAGLADCALTLLVGWERGQDLDPRVIYERARQNCNQQLWDSAQGVLFENGNLTTSPYLFLTGSSQLSFGEDPSLYTRLAVLDELPKVRDCSAEDDGCNMDEQVMSGGDPPTISLSESEWFPCQFSESRVQMQCGGWTLELAEADENLLKSRSWAYDNFPYRYHHPVALETVEVSYDAYIAVTVQSPSGVVNTFVNIPDLGEPQLPGRVSAKEAKLYSLAFDATPGSFPPLDLPLPPTYFDPRNWRDEGTAEVWQAYPAAPYFGAIGVDGVLVGSRRGAKIISYEGEEVGCIYHGGDVLIGPDLPTARTIHFGFPLPFHSTVECLDCEGRWFYIAQPPQ